MRRGAPRRVRQGRARPRAPWRGRGAPPPTPASRRADTARGGVSPADEGEEHPCPDADAHQRDGDGRADLEQDQRLRDGEEQARRRDRAAEPPADAGDLRQALAIDGLKPEREENREERQDGEQVAGIDRVAEGEDDDDHGAPQRQEPDGDGHGLRPDFAASQSRTGQPRNEKMPAKR